jgi:tRNA modification GTPase
VLLDRETDTIAAVATPMGEGGISVIRISGERALLVADRGFRGTTSLSEAPSHTAHYGAFMDEHGVAIDNLVATVFRMPHSYTGEDTVELSCHGGRYLTQLVLDALIGFGARAAEAGEFTKRAFLNNRIDLAQAEAVADLIQARSERAHRVSLSQLNGSLSDRLSAIREKLIGSIALLELELDFSEDGYEFTNKTQVAEQIRNAIAEINELIVSYRAGKIFRDGVKVALAGAPNVGKSSLLNAFLREERAIVTNIPGTTRDIIEESVTLGGIIFDISDTAGLRESVDPIEREGVRRAQEILAKCDILLLMLDGSRAVLDEEAATAINLLNGIEHRGAACIIAVNKADIALNPKPSHAGLAEKLSKHKVLDISCKTLDGFRELETELVRIILGGSIQLDESDVTITNARHHSSLIGAKQSLELALESTISEKSGEFIAVDLRSGLNYLGEIIGVVTTEDILGAIFSKFCIGK